MGVAGAVIELEHRVIGHAVRRAVRHGQVAGGNARILEQLLKDHPRNAAGEVDKIIVVLHFLQKGGVRQKPAVPAVVTGKGFLNAGGKIFVKVGVQLHGPIGEHRLGSTRVQQMENDLIQFDVHGKGSLLLNCPDSIAYFVPKGHREF